MSSSTDMVFHERKASNNISTTLTLSTSKFILIIVDFNKNNCLLTSMKQLPIELFKSFAFFLGHPV